MRKVLLLTTLLVFIFTSQIWAADISGTWVLKYQGRSGDERALDMVIKAAGKNLTITTTHPSLGEMAGTGKLVGNDITITLMATGERKVGFELKGIVTDNKMAGTRETVRPEGDSSEGSDRSSGDRPSRDSDDSSDRSSGDRPSRDSDDSSGRSSGDRPSRDSGDSSGRSSGEPPSGAQGDDSGGRQRQATSNTWTAEKK
jgi:hypothetical protein